MPGDAGSPHKGERNDESTLQQQGSLATGGKSDGRSCEVINEHAQVHYATVLAFGFQQFGPTW